MLTHDNLVIRMSHLLYFLRVKQASLFCSSSCSEMDRNGEFKPPHARSGFHTRAIKGGETYLLVMGCVGGRSIIVTKEASLFKEYMSMIKYR